MTAICLKILEPTDDTAYFGSPQVTFRGAVIGLPKELEHVTLCYRWYSSLNPAEEDHYSMNETALTDPGAPFSAQLGVGSHVITFAVSDRLGQTAADMEAILHGGVTGGSKGDGKCVIHVFKANLIKPGESDVLQRNTSTLIAEAPLIWGQVKPDTKPIQFEMNPEYHKVNRLQYRWEFTPIGSPSGRQAVNFIPANNQYVFEQQDEDSKLMILRYTGSLPGSLTGDYRLTLHVEDNKDVFGGHQASIGKCTVT
jgi:hypothetical protein